jgi:hypothetical protein
MTKLLFAIRDSANAPKNVHKEEKEMGSQAGTSQGTAASVLKLTAYKGSTR